MYSEHDPRRNPNPGNDFSRGKFLYSLLIGIWALAAVSVLDKIETRRTAMQAVIREFRPDSGYMASVPGYDALQFVRDTSKVEVGDTVNVARNAQGQLEAILNPTQ